MSVITFISAEEARKLTREAIDKKVAEDLSEAAGAVRVAINAATKMGEYTASVDLAKFKYSFKLATELKKLLEEPTVGYECSIDDNQHYGISLNIKWVK